MRFSATRLTVFVAASVLTAGTAGAQGARQAAGQAASGRVQAEQARAQIAVMERLLERAVGEGIAATRAQMPEMFSIPLMISGNNRVRGFRVEDYGVFFDVEVPGLPKSIAWSMRVIARNNDAVILRELSDLRVLVGKAVTDEKDKAEVQRRIALLESRVSGVAPGFGGGTPHVLTRPPAPRPASTRPGEAGTPTVAQLEINQDVEPDAVYVGEVKDALIRAILDNGVAIPIAADNWLTVAARPSDDPDNGTLYLTISGKDLAALRAGQITRDEARKRIREREF